MSVNCKGRPAGSGRYRLTGRYADPMRKKRIVILLLLVLSLTAGCAKKHSMYEWGSYEDQIYAMYSDTGKVPVEQQIDSLERDYQVARSENKPVPPGYHAHLGYLYYQVGKIGQSLQSFETEKQLFPESKQYMDFLISRITHSAHS
jgi:hypothetical protein